MSPTRLRTLAILLALMAAACATPRAEGTPPPDEGDRAPALVLPAANGGTYSLEAETKERAVVLVFYRGKF